MEILQLINNGSKQLKNNNIYTHKLDSEILLSKVLKISREKLLMNLNQKVEAQKIIYFNKLVNRRSSKEPVAYILQEKEQVTIFVVIQNLRNQIFFIFAAFLQRPLFIRGCLRATRLGSSLLT